MGWAKESLKFDFKNSFLTCGKVGYTADSLRKQCGYRSCQTNWLACSGYKLFDSDCIPERLFLRKMV